MFSKDSILNSVAEAYKKMSKDMMEFTDEAYGKVYTIKKEDANEFITKAAAAKKAGQTTFKFGDKTYPVTIKIDPDKILEAEKAMKDASSKKKAEVIINPTDDDLRESESIVNEGFKKGDTVKWAGDKTVKYKIEKDAGKSNKTGVKQWKIVQIDNPKRGAIAGEPDLKKESVDEMTRFKMSPSQIKKLSKTTDKITSDQMKRMMSNDVKRREWLNLIKKFDKSSLQQVVDMNPNSPVSKEVQAYIDGKIKESVNEESLNEAKNDDKYVVIAFHEKGGGFVMTKPASKKDAEDSARSITKSRDITQQKAVKVSDARKIKGLVGKQYLDEESLNEANGEFVVFIEKDNGRKKLLHTKKSQRAANMFLTKNVDKILNTSGIRSVGTMSKDEWEKTEARFAESVNEESLNEMSDLEFVGDQLANAVADGMMDRREFISFMSAETKFDKNALGKIYDAYLDLDARERMKMDMTQNMMKFLKGHGLKESVVNEQSSNRDVMAISRMTGVPDYKIEDFMKRHRFKDANKVKKLVKGMGSKKDEKFAKMVDGNFSLEADFKRMYKELG